MELWDLIAREQIRDTLARYSWRGDAMRLDEHGGAWGRLSSVDPRAPARGWR